MPCGGRPAGEREFFPLSFAESGAKNSIKNNKSKTARPFGLAPLCGSIADSMRVGFCFWFIGAPTAGRHIAFPERREGNISRERRRREYIAPEGHIAAYRAVRDDFFQF